MKIYILEHVAQKMKKQGIEAEGKENILSYATKQNAESTTQNSPLCNILTVM